MRAVSSSDPLSQTLISFRNHRARRERSTNPLDGLREPCQMTTGTFGVRTIVDMSAVSSAVTVAYLLTSPIF
jgi:hypothetical protein